jgi:twitching motility protein PilT
MLAALNHDRPIAVKPVHGPTDDQLSINSGPKGRAGTGRSATISAVATVNSRGIDPWLEGVWKAGGTDLLLTAGASPLMRVDGEIQPAGNDRLDARDTEKLVRELIGEELWEELEEHRSVDFAFTWNDRARLRANAFHQRDTVALALRMIPTKIPTMDEIRLPQSVRDLCVLPRGLVLLTGPTGTGKSTTLAAMIEWINEHRKVHVLTVEDPIEYIHQHKNSAVNQREVGPDAHSFADALRAALREDPDVLLVGEMRDLESISIALTMAETGHLVFATLHTNDAAQALDRIIDVFPAERQAQVRVQLSGSLAAVIAQRLLPKPDGGLVAAFEVLIGSHAARNLVREGKTNQLRNVIATGHKEGMQTLEESLNQLLADRIIDEETALSVTLFPKEIKVPPPLPEPEEGADDTVVVGTEAPADAPVAARRRGLRR